MTLLMCAASLGNSMLVELLLEAGELPRLPAALTDRSSQAATGAFMQRTCPRASQELCGVTLAGFRHQMLTHVLSGCWVQGRLQELLQRATNSSSTPSPWCWTTQTLTSSCGPAAPPGPCLTAMTFRMLAASGAEGAGLGIWLPIGTQQTRFALRASCLLALLDMQLSPERSRTSFGWLQDGGKAAADSGAPATSANGNLPGEDGRCSLAADQSNQLFQ